MTCAIARAGRNVLDLSACRHFREASKKVPLNSTLHGWVDDPWVVCRREPEKTDF